MSLSLAKQLRAGCAAISILCLLSSHIRPSLAQQPSPTDVEQFLRNAAKVAEARDKELADLRAMVSELVNRNRALEGQIEATLQMQAQALAIQMKSLSGEAKDRTVKEVRDFAAQGRQAMDAAIDKLKKGASPEEKRLGAAVEKLKSIIPSDAEVATMAKEKFDQLQKEIESAKRGLETELRSYGKDLAEQLRSKCRSNADSATLVAAARSGASDKELQGRATQMGCEVGSDLLDKLANARNAEQAQAAFQSAMTSMMMLAISSGNPYVMAAVAVIMLLSTLFSGSGSGGGGGSGGPGGSGPDGRIGSGTGESSSSSSGPATPTPYPTPGPQAGTGTGSSSPGLQMQTSAKGCTVTVDDKGDTLTIVPPEQQYRAYSIKLSTIGGAKPQNFPTSWRDPLITLSRCDGSTEALYIWWRPGPQVNPLCFMLYKKESTYLVTDKEYGVGDKAATCTPL